MASTYGEASILSLYRAGHSIRSIARTVNTDENGRSIKPQEALRIVEQVIFEDYKKNLN